MFASVCCVNVDSKRDIELLNEAIEVCGRVRR